MAYQQGSSSTPTQTANGSGSGNVTAFTSGGTASGPSHPTSGGSGTFTGSLAARPYYGPQTTTPAPPPPLVTPEPPPAINWTPKVITADQFFSNPAYQDAWQQISDALGLTPDQAKVQYAGIPIVQLYVDQQGNYQPNSVQFLGASKQIQQLANMQAPLSFQDWMTKNGYTTTDPTAIMGYMGDLASQLMAGPDTQAQSDYAAQQLGFGNSANYQGTLSNLLDGSYQDNPNYQAYQRTVERQAEQVRQESMQMAEAVGLQSSGRQIQLMNETTSKISDTRLQAEFSFMQYDQSQRLTEYQALVDANNKTQGQYADQIYQNRMGALQAYATQFTSAMTQRQGYLDQYSKEYDLMNQNADAVYKSIMAQLGYSDAALSQAQEQWNSLLASWKTQFDAELQKYALENNVNLANAQLEAQKTASSQSTATSIFGGILGFLGVLAAL